eukprot:s5066_g5.t1
MAVLNVTGDWAWLAKCGHLARTCLNVEKRPRGVNAVPKGICHWCKAGQLNVPFEDFRRRPIWKSTCFEAGDNPFTSVPTLLQLPHDPNRPGSFFIYDFWHSFHLGLGKTFLASVLALISDRMGSSNIDGRFAELSDLYLQWCDEQHETAYLTAINKETIGWIDRGKYPNGFWNKGHITVLLLRFVGHWLRTHTNEIADCPMLSQCGLATQQINEAISSMYRQDVWMKKDVANDIGNKGLSFVETYGRLARWAYDNSKALWALMPKGHVVHHTFCDLFEAADEWVINPLVFAVQISEDFVGKKSRLARTFGLAMVQPQELSSQMEVSTVDAGPGKYLVKYARNGSPVLSVWPFGSSANGCGEGNSDLDMVVSADEKPKRKAVNALLKIADECWMHGFEVEDFRPNAKVPILMLQKDGLDIDLSCGNLLPLLNTRLLRSYTLLNPRLSVVAAAVKRWAKAHGIAKTFDGFISSYAWTLMVVYYMQIKDQLPSLHRLLEWSNKGYQILNDYAWNFLSLEDAKQMWHGDAHMNSAELLRGFFSFYATDFVWGSEVVSASCLKSDGKIWGFSAKVPGGFEVHMPFLQQLWICENREGYVI